jgi:hypothetical protein
MPSISSDPDKAEVGKLISNTAELSILAMNAYVDDWKMKRGFVEGFLLFTPPGLMVWQTSQSDQTPV